MESHGQLPLVLFARQELKVSPLTVETVLVLDTEGQLCAELVGVCGDVPTYGVDDLVEILELVSNSTSSSLLHSRPLKVLNYLKVCCASFSSPLFCNPFVYGLP